MKSRNFLLSALLLGAAMFSSCKSDSTSPTDAAKAQFTASGTLKEGKAITFTNTSEAATSYSWSSTPAAFTSTEKNPTFAFDTAGTYVISLVAKGPGGSDTARQTIIVGADMRWRMTNDSSKVWHITSLSVNGQETVGAPCSLDNTVRLAVNPDVFEVSEGADVCPPSQQVIQPQSGTFTANADYSKITLDITSPSTSSIDYNITTLTKGYAVGEADTQVGHVVIKLSY